MRRFAASSIIGAGAVPDVKLNGLDGQLHDPRRGKPFEDGLERALLGDPAVDSLLTAKARGELERLAAILSESAEGTHQEVPVWKRMADVHGGVPGGEHRDVVVVELREGPGVVGLELVVGNLLYPGANGLAEKLPASLAPDRIGDRANGVSGVDEAQRHSRAKIEGGSDGTLGDRDGACGEKSGSVAERRPILRPDAPGRT